MQGFIDRAFYLNKLIARQNNGLVKVITGIRRCGKSYLLFKMFKDYLVSQGVKDKNIIAISLDDDAYIKFRDTDYLSQYVREIAKSRDQYYLFIDEVQYAITRNEMNNPDEIKLYNVLNGLMHLGNVDIYVTGSNSKLLSKDILTAFRGRGDEIKMHPLTFKEYYSFVGGDKVEAYEEFALFGGMPQVLTYKEEQDKQTYLKTLFELVYFRDILERYEIKHSDILAYLTDDLCSSVGSLTNASKISRTLKSVNNINVSSNTISNYLTYLTESFLFQESKRYDIKGKRYFEYPSKYYASDIGLRNARLNFRQLEETHAMENIIFNELVARGYSVDVGVVEIPDKIDSKRTRKRCEIDFVVNAGNEKYYIQSALSVADEVKMNTELRPLKSTNDFFKKIIVNKSTARSWFDDCGIFHIGLYEFLLTPEALF